MGVQMAGIRIGAFMALHGKRGPWSDSGLLGFTETVAYAERVVNHLLTVPKPHDCETNNRNQSVRLAHVVLTGHFENCSLGRVASA